MTDQPVEAPVTEAQAPAEPVEDKVPPETAEATKQRLDILVAEYAAIKEQKAALKEQKVPIPDTLDKAAWIHRRQIRACKRALGIPLDREIKAAEKAAHPEAAATEAAPKAEKKGKKAKAEKAVDPNDQPVITADQAVDHDLTDEELKKVVEDATPTTPDAGW